MKTYNEIIRKIDELMEKAKNITDSDEKEALYNQIDALLWVIGDTSGKPI